MLGAHSLSRRQNNQSLARALKHWYSPWARAWAWIKSRDNVWPGASNAPALNENGSHDPAAKAHLTFTHAQGTATTLRDIHRAYGGCTEKPTASAMANFAGLPTELKLSVFAFETSGRHLNILLDRGNGTLQHVRVDLNQHRWPNYTYNED
ncbi:hypothetical protein PMIN03_011802 [Paraphaeosphaeria minitans]